MGFTSSTFQHFYGLYRAAGRHLPQVFLHEPDSGVPPPPPPPPLPAVKTNSLHSLPKGNAPGQTPCKVTPQSANSAASAGEAAHCTSCVQSVLDARCLTQFTCGCSGGAGAIYRAGSIHVSVYTSTMRTAKCSVVCLFGTECGCLFRHAIRHVSQRQTQLPGHWSHPSDAPLHHGRSSTGQLRLCWTGLQAIACLFCVSF